MSIDFLSCDLVPLLSMYIHVGTSLDSSPWVTVLDCIVILISFVSMVQCLRSLINSWHLAITVRKFFFMKFDNFRVKVHHLLPLFNFWHVGVIVTNVLVIVGSLLKMLISYNVSPCPSPFSLSLSLSLSLSSSLSLCALPPSKSSSHFLQVEFRGLSFLFYYLFYYILIYSLVMPSTQYSLRVSSLLSLTIIDGSLTLTHVCHMTMRVIRA